MILKSLYRVVTGNSPEVLNELHDPTVMGVIWRGLWSPESMRFATQQAEQARLDKNPGPVIEIPFANSTDGKIYRGEANHLTAILSTLGGSLGVNSKPRSRSRIEPPIGHKMLNIAAAPHVDGGPLHILSVPAGVTTDILMERPSGHFLANYFKPEVPLKGIPLENNSAAIMKGMAFPRSRLPKEMARETLGLIHWRPNDILAQDRSSYRFLFLASLSD